MTRLLRVRVISFYVIHYRHWFAKNCFIPNKILNGNYLHLAPWAQHHLHPATIQISISYQSSLFSIRFWLQYHLTKMGELLRRYLCKRLSKYYAQPADKVVGSIDSGFIARIPSGIQSCEAATLSSHGRSVDVELSKRGGGIHFASLWGEWHWKQTYKRVYKEQRGMWLTPSELFTPYYSNILADFVAQSMNISLRNLRTYKNNEGKFEIIELGGGVGLMQKYCSTICVNAIQICMRDYTNIKFLIQAQLCMNCKDKFSSWEMTKSPDYMLTKSNLCMLIWWMLQRESKCFCFHDHTAKHIISLSVPFLFSLRLNLTNHNLFPHDYYRGISNWLEPLSSFLTALLS